MELSALHHLTFYRKKMEWRLRREESRVAPAPAQPGEAARAGAATLTALPALPALSAPVGCQADELSSSTSSNCSDGGAGGKWGAEGGERCQCVVLARLYEALPDLVSCGLSLGGGCTRCRCRGGVRAGACPSPEEAAFLRGAARAPHSSTHSSLADLTAPAATTATHAATTATTATHAATTATTATHAATTATHAATTATHAATTASVVVLEGEAREGEGRHIGPQGDGRPHCTPRRRDSPPSLLDWSGERSGDASTLVPHAPHAWYAPRCDVSAVDEGYGSRVAGAGAGAGAGDGYAAHYTHYTEALPYCSSAPPAPPAPPAPAPSPAALDSGHVDYYTSRELNYVTREEHYMGQKEYYVSDEGHYATHDDYYMSHDGYYMSHDDYYVRGAGHAGHGGYSVTPAQQDCYSSEGYDVADTGGDVLTERCDAAAGGGGCGGCGVSRGDVSAGVYVERDGRPAPAPAPAPAQDAGTAERSWRRRYEHVAGSPNLRYGCSGPMYRPTPHMPRVALVRPPPPRRPHAPAHIEPAWAPRAPPPPPPPPTHWATRALFQPIREQGVERAEQDLAPAGQTESDAGCRGASSGSSGSGSSVLARQQHVRLYRRARTQFQLQCARLQHGNLHLHGDLE